MALPLDPETIARVRRTSELVSVVSWHIPLRKHGSLYQGLCPFHSEKTPSFKVNPQRQRYHCFGCGARGDVIDFIMRVESISFRDAVIKLADLAGIPVGRLSRADAAEWAAERRSIRADENTASLWRRAAVAIGSDLVDHLKTGVRNPRVRLQVGEVADWTRRVERWRATSGRDLVMAYRRWRDADPLLAVSMVRAAARYQHAEAEALRDFIEGLQ